MYVHNSNIHFYLGLYDIFKILNKKCNFNKYLKFVCAYEKEKIMLSTS